MECIELNNDEFASKKKLLNEGYESQIFVYQHDNKEILIKKYYELDQVDIDKIELVSKLKTNILIKPSKLVKIGNEIVGFTMEDYMKNFYQIKIMKNVMSDEEKYNLLVILKNEIINLRKQNCIYGDLSLKNVITDGVNVRLCDSVNVKIDDYNFDQISSNMQKYFNLKNTYDGIDSYMLNLLTIYLLNDIEYDQIIELMEENLILKFSNKEYINYRGMMDNQECMTICYDMISDKVTKDFLIDYLSFEKEKTIK